MLGIAEIDASILRSFESLGSLPRMTKNQPPSESTSALQVITNPDTIDLEALELLKAFCLDPLSDATGQLIDAFVARRAPRGRLKVI